MRLVIKFRDNPPDCAHLTQTGTIEIPLGPGAPESGETRYPVELRVVSEEGEKLIEHGRTLIVGPRGGLSLSPP